ncbi:MAG: hypothetical protein ACO1O1_10135 [Adhaeribacter sp.]
MYPKTDWLIFFICLVTAWGLTGCAASSRAPKPLWTDIPQGQWQEKGIEVPGLLQYRVLKLDSVELRRLLQRETEKDIRKARNLLLLPFPDGSMAGFRFVCSATTAWEPAAGKGGSSTYFGQGIQDASLGLAFDLGPAGFHAMITSGSGTVYISPLNLEGHRYYLCYFKHHLRPGFRRPFEEYGPIKSPNNR